MTIEVVEVDVPENNAVRVEYTKDGESKTAYYTGKDNDDRNNDHFWDVISDLSDGYLAADTNKPITVTLLKDIALENTTILVDAQKDVTINGNGHTITATLKNAMGPGTAGADAVSITSDSKLTLNDVKLDIKAADDAVTLSGETSTQGIYNAGQLTLTNGTEVTVDGVSKDGINGGGTVTISGEGTKLTVENVGGSAIKCGDLTAGEGTEVNISNTPYHGISGANVTINNAKLLRELSRPDRLTEFLEDVCHRCRFQSMFFGHYHENMIIRQKYVLLYEQIIRLKEYPSDEICIEQK